MPVSFCDTRLLISQTAKQHLVKSIIGGLAAAELVKSIQTFRPLSPKFYRGSRSAKFCLDFRHHSHLTSCGFETEQYAGNVKHLTGAAMIGLRFDLIRQPVPQFLQEGSNTATFGLILACEAFQYGNEAMTPNTNCGSIDDSCMSEKLG